MRNKFIYFLKKKSIYFVCVRRSQSYGLDTVTHLRNYGHTGSQQSRVHATTTATYMYHWCTSQSHLQRLRINTIHIDRSKNLTEKQQFQFFHVADFLKQIAFTFNQDALQIQLPIEE